MKHWSKYISSCIWSSILIAQIILVFVFGVNHENGLQCIRITGYIVWMLSAFFGWWPIYILKRHGGVRKGEAYVHTSVLVDKGLYAIVRHPQYLAGILFSLALILVSQTWLIGGLGVIGMGLMYRDICLADRHEIQKFGDKYRRYMKNVPRINFLLGIIRILKQKRDAT